MNIGVPVNILPYFSHVVLPIISMQRVPKVSKFISTYHNDLSVTEICTETVYDITNISLANALIEK